MDQGKVFGKLGSIVLICVPHYKLPIHMISFRLLQYTFFLIHTRNSRRVYFIATYPYQK